MLCSFGVPTAAPNTVTWSFNVVLSLGAHTNKQTQQQNNLDDPHNQHRRTFTHTQTLINLHALTLGSNDHNKGTLLSFRTWCKETAQVSTVN